MSVLMDAWKHCLAIRSEPKHFTQFAHYTQCTEFHAVFNDIDHSIICKYPGTAMCSNIPYIFIVFRGTKNEKAWESNFDPYPLRADNAFKDGEWGKGTIHDGFYSSWMKMREQIMDIVRPYKNKDEYNIVCCGHSRGGALAMLCGRHLIKNEGFDCVSVYAFGTPMQGNSEYVKQMNELMNKGLIALRITNGWDYVTSLPPEALGFRHCAPETRMPVPFWHKLRFMRLLDHRYESYTKSIKKYLA